MKGRINKIEQLGESFQLLSVALTKILIDYVKYFGILMKYLYKKNY